MDNETFIDSFPTILKEMVFQNGIICPFCNQIIKFTDKTAKCMRFECECKQFSITHFNDNQGIDYWFYLKKDNKTYAKFDPKIEKIIFYPTSFSFSREKFEIKFVSWSKLIDFAETVVFYS